MGRMFAYLYSMSYSVLSADIFLCLENNLFHVDNRQEYDVREERRRELEFLEKVWEFS